MLSLSHDLTSIIRQNRISLTWSAPRKKRIFLTMCFSSFLGYVPHRETDIEIIKSQNSEMRSRTDIQQPTILQRNSGKSKGTDKLKDK